MACRQKHFVPTSCRRRISKVAEQPLPERLRLRAAPFRHAPQGVATLAAGYGFRRSLVQPVSMCRIERSRIERCRCPSSVKLSWCSRLQPRQGAQTIRSSKEPSPTPRPARATWDRRALRPAGSAGANDAVYNNQALQCPSRICISRRIRLAEWIPPHFARPSARKTAIVSVRLGTRTARVIGAARAASSAGRRSTSARFAAKTFVCATTSSRTLRQPPRPVSPTRIVGAHSSVSSLDVFEPVYTDSWR